MIKNRISTLFLHAAVVLTFILVFAVTGTEAETYSYDTLGRLARIVYPDGTSIDYTYDTNGNRLTLTANAPTKDTGGTGGGNSGDDNNGGGGGGGGCFIDTLK